MIRDYLQGLKITRSNGEVVADRSSAIPEFVQQLSILRASKATLSSSLMKLTSILQADLFDSEIESATALTKSGFLRAAGAMCGDAVAADVAHARLVHLQQVLIEKHLKQVCINHQLRIRKKNPTISESLTIRQWRHIQHLADLRNLNQALKSNESLTIRQWRHIQHLADLRNLCDHNTRYATGESVQIHTSSSGSITMTRARSSQPFRASCSSRPCLIASLGRVLPQP